MSSVATLCRKSYGLTCGARNGQFAVWAGWLDADGLWNDPERLTELGPWTTPVNPILAPPAVLRHSDGRAGGAWLGYSGSIEDLSINVWSAELR